jgi:DNA processing protein
MDVDARVEAWAFLQLVSGVGARSLVALLKHFGGPIELRAAKRKTIAALGSADVAAAIERGPDPSQLERTLAWLRGMDHRLVAWGDVEYPRALLDIADPPPAFYYVGRPELLTRRAVAIVGSRNATPQGVEHAEAFAAALSASGFTIVSGLAVGIDAAAHRGGLSAGGSSIAVVGTGLDRVYPARNRDLAQRLAREGGMLSEFALGTPPLPENFPRRNRLISGLARGVVVVEATLHSGSLITARLAAEQGRDVFAIPGSIDSPFSKGAHRLIREGAKLVETAQDILEELGAAAEAQATNANRAPNEAAAPSPGEGPVARVLAALGHDPAGIDLLVRRSGLSAESITVALVELEVAGRVVSLPGGLYQRRE